MAFHEEITLITTKGSNDKNRRNKFNLFYSRNRRQHLFMKARILEQKLFNISKTNYLAQPDKRLYHRLNTLQR